MTITKKQKELLRHKIEWEGFDYCFTEYSDWKEIKDPKFHALRFAWTELRNEFIDYLHEHGITESGESTEEDESVLLSPDEEVPLEDEEEDEDEDYDYDDECY